MTSVSGVAVSLTAARVCLLLLGSAIVANAAPTAPGKPRFHDSFESTAAVAAGKEGGPGRRLSGPVTLGEGKDAEGAKLAGVAQIRYEPVTDILDPSGGELEFRVKLHFDPTESNQRTRTVLRNQIFASFWDTKRGYTNVSVYNAGRETYAVCVMNAARNIVFYRAFSAVWRRGEWHRLKLTWGRELSLWCDGEKKVGGPFHGLFGPVTFDPATTVLYLGTQIGYSNIESQFTIADLTIRGPAGDQVTRRPRITLPLLRGAPPLDGRLDGPFWRDACRVQGFLRFPTDELAALQPYLLAAYTADGLWLGIETTLLAGTAPRAVLKERDSPIYTEDTVEFFLQPETMPAADFFQFMVSAIGTRYDAKHSGGKADVAGYNPQWQCAAGSGPGRWSAEAFIPFKALGLSAAPAAGTLWRGNFCVDSAAGFSHAMIWAHVVRNFGEPLGFGEFLFSGKPRTVRQELFRGFDTGEPLLAYHLVGDFQPIITVTGDLADGNGANLFRNSLRLRDTKSIDLRPPTLTTGKYLMSVEGLDETGQVAFYQSFRFQTAKAFDLAVRNSCQQARAYADYFAAGVPWVMDQIGFDGFYSDGLTNITACQNEAHGCGYRDRDGNLHATYPFFATRETLKRMYRLVKARNPNGLVVNHCSFNLMTPILSFSDVVYTGEHEDYENPLTARLRFSSKPWGLYLTLLGSTERGVNAYDPLYAMVPLLSGTSMWGSGIIGRNDFGRKDAALRDAYHAFDTKTATWSPWWENQRGACRTDDPMVRVSFYCHPGKDVLLLAGNFHPENKTAAIRLDLAKCGLAGRLLKAHNVLTGVPIAVSADGRFSPMIRGKSFVLLRLE